MKWQEAHLRMLESLPRRTHYAPEHVGDLNWKHWRRGGKEKRPVVIKGVQYDSLSLAAKALQSNRPAIWKMIERGEAAFA